MGHYLLPANTARYADDIRTDTVGFQSAAQVGRCVGEMADKVSDGAFLWCHALLRGFLRVTAIRYCTMYSSREPDGNNRQ